MRLSTAMVRPHLARLLVVSSCISLLLALAVPARAAGIAVDAVDAIHHSKRAMEVLGADATDSVSGMVPSEPAPREGVEGFVVGQTVNVDFLGRDVQSTDSEVGVVYPDVATAADLVFQQLNESSRHLLVLENSSAPESYGFRVNTQTKSRLQTTPEGGVRVIDRMTGDDLLYVRPPWAEDAVGKAVPTEFEIEGDIIVQRVHHRALDNVVYPIVADPHYDCGWVTCTLYFNRHETLLISVGAGAGTIACFLLPLPADVACALAIYSFQGTASYAYARGGCLKAKHNVGWPTVGAIWPDTHYGSPWCT